MNVMRHAHLIQLLPSLEKVDKEPLQERLKQDLQEKWDIIQQVHPDQKEVVLLFLGRQVQWQHPLHVFRSEGEWKSVEGTEKVPCCAMTLLFQRTVGHAARPRVVRGILSSQGQQNQEGNPPLRVVLDLTVQCGLPWRGEDIPPSLPFSWYGSHCLLSDARDCLTSTQGTQYPFEEGSWWCWREEGIVPFQQCQKGSQEDGRAYEEDRGGCEVSCGHVHLCISKKLKSSLEVEIWDPTFKYVQRRTVRKKKDSFKSDWEKGFFFVRLHSWAQALFKTEGGEEFLLPLDRPLVYREGRWMEAESSLGEPLLFLEQGDRSGVRGSLYTPYRTQRKRVSFPARGRDDKTVEAVDVR